MKKFDVVIIGSGMGGLICGSVLAKEGKSVCILEKNQQIGGSLQTFSRNKTVFDSGVHYVGGLEKGQNLFQVFTYLGIMEDLKLERLDSNGFDRILIGNDPHEYRQAQGYDNFVQQLLADFPDEAVAIQAYCTKMKEICDRFALYNLRTNGLYEEKAAVQQLDTRAFIESLTANQKLQAVLLGNNALYVGIPDETPFYIHALVINSYIESAWRFINGGSQIGKLLARGIRQAGGEIVRRSEVNRLHVEDGRIIFAETAEGQRYYGNDFISNIHPAKTLEITATDRVKRAYRNRIASLPHTISCFLLHIVFKKECFPYFKYNYYYHQEGELWNLTNYTEENWPLGYGVFPAATPNTQTFAEAMTILAYMRYEELAPWHHTFNTVVKEQSRGEDYEAFKKRKAEILLNRVEERFPGIRSCIASYTCATPLSFRDYIGNYDGTLYGISKNYKDPLKTFISPRTKIPNLYLTGQNINLHGVLGCTISALLTCITLLGNEDVIEKIKDANRKKDS